MKPQLTYTDRWERNFIALILGLMTMVTFTNVVIRKLQELDFWRADWFAPFAQPISNFGLQSFEITVFLFAWLVIVGTPYTVKMRAQLGVDIVLQMMTPAWRKRTTLVAVGACLLYSLLLLKGSYDYWAPFINLPPTEGRWFPQGFKERFLERGYYEVNDIYMPMFAQFLSEWFNYGDAYEKIPRFIPYFALPLGTALLVWRYIGVAVDVVKDRANMIIASHEVEEHNTHHLIEQEDEQAPNHTKVGN